ncbi:MAG: hypothetical protein CVT49_09055 [candidate division Zixibacteria bacterium HGW-Zixibacteria-1]|nr:MAG: hypothetical protein CVT49_09055 [candidate division Zixibacteria bacterium HGW-Zixibacteria-1]
MAMNHNDKITVLVGRIKSVLLKEKLILFSAGLLGTITALLVVSILLSLMAGIIILPVWLKVGLLVMSGLASVYIFWKLALSRLFSGSVESIAVRLEKKFPQLKGRLIAAIQFSVFAEEDRRYYSNDLIEATLVQAAENARSLNFGSVVSGYPVWRNFRTFAGMAALAVALLVVFPGFFSYSYKVYSRPTELVTQPLGYKLKAYPGSQIAIKYRDVDLGGVLTGEKFPDKATVYYKFSEGIWQKSEIDLTGRAGIRTAIGDSLLFVTTLKQVRRSLDYYVEAGREQTPVAHIDVVDRPRVTGIKLSLFYPGYTGLAPTVIDENDGSMSAVVGTRVNMKIETNTGVDIAELIFEDSSRSKFEISGQTAEQSFRIDRDRSYLIHLVDKQGEENPDPIEYHITAIPDEYPVIEVVRPGVDINLNEEMMVPILLRISDDYGFSSLVLKYDIVSDGRRGEENVAVLNFSDRIKTEGEINFNWDIEPLRLMPSDYIEYHFDLADNDAVSGPKITSSRIYIARLPSLEEIIAQTEAEYNQNVDKTEEYLKQQKDLSERMKSIARKLEQEKANSDNKLSWQHQKELQDIAEKEEDISRQLEQTADKMNNLIDKMQESRFAGRELLEKLAEIQKLFEEIATPEMREARLKLLEALKQMDKDMLNQALKDYQMSQEEMMRRLDRTIALLKKMQIEQKIDAMTEMTRELAEKQTKVNENTTDSNPEKLPSLTPSEQKVRDGMDGLKNEAQKLRDMLKETAYKMAEEADKFCKAVESNDAAQNMENMISSMSEKDKETSLKQGEQALSKLLSLLDQLQQGQAKMCKGGGAEVAQKMRDAIDDINYLSNNEEDLINRTGEIRSGSDVLRDLAGEQQIVRESVTGLSKRIEELGKESPFLAANLHGLANYAMNNLDLAIDKLSDRRSNDALGYQREALWSLNRAALNMLDALEQQSQCNKGGSCDKPSQKMESLCMQQQQLNMQTQSQCNNPNNMSPGGEEALKRLAAEQGAIQKSLSELEKEFGSSREVLGRLDAVAQDMEKVVDQLSNGEVGQETLDRQLKIYSRMLDATRTMQRKDFTEQRKASVGLDVLRSSPGALSGNNLQGGLNIEDRLRQFLNESYPQEYEQHIKAYFKALLESVYQSPPPAMENE